MGCIAAQRILDDDQLEMQVLTPQCLEETTGRVPLAIVFIRTVLMGAYSGEVGHAFQSKPATYSGDSGHPGRSVATRLFMVFLLAVLLYCQRGLFPHRSSFELQSVGIVDQPIKDGVSRGGVADLFMPVLDRQLAGDQCGVQTVAIL